MSILRHYQVGIKAGKKINKSRIHISWRSYNWWQRWRLSFTHGTGERCDEQDMGVVKGWGKQQSDYFKVEVKMEITIPLWNIQWVRLCPYWYSGRGKLKYLKMFYCRFVFRLLGSKLHIFFNPESTRKHFKAHCVCLKEIGYAHTVCH